MIRSPFSSALFCCGLLAVGCHAAEDDRASPVGTATMALSATGNGGNQYELQTAQVRFTGPTTTTVTADPADELLEVDLTPADYSVRLLTGWQLARLDGGVATVVPATLVSQNPVNISIIAGQISPVDFLFDVSGELIPFGFGRASVSISVFEGGAAGTGGGMCTTNQISIGDPACAACVDGSCCTELQACDGSQECLDFLGCAGACPDQTCVDDCGAMFPVGAAQLADLQTCMQGSCGVECGGGMAGTGGTGGMGGTGGTGGTGSDDICGTGVSTGDLVCNACLGGGCCTEFTQCWNDPTCQTCLTGGDPALCTGTMLDEVLIACWNDQCSAECGGI